MAKQTFTSGQVLTAQQMNDLQTNDFNMSVSTQTANYTLVAADKGTREVMNMATAGTVTVPNSTFNAGDAVWLHSIGSGTITVSAGAGLTLNSSAGTAPTLAQWEGGVVYFTSASAAIFFRGGGATYGVATGGTSSNITVSGLAYRLLTFTATGTLTVTKAGLFDVYGGGGGGAGSMSEFGGGGGGAGSLWTTTLYLDANQTITIGAGGAKQVFSGARQGQSGSATTIGTMFTAVGGGFGGGQDRPRGGSGGSGGGAGYSGAAENAGISIDGFGFGGGGGTSTGYPNGGGGGGGGASAAGGNASGTTGGTGGAGKDISAWLGQSANTTIKGGGGGGGSNGGSGGTGGSGGGTNGNTATAAAANSSAGGGGGGFSTDVSAGGSGFVYVRFKV